MKKLVCLATLSFLSCSIAYADALDVLTPISGASMGVGAVTNIIHTKSLVDYNKAMVKKVEAETEDIKKNGSSLKIVPQPDGTAKVYQNGVEIKSDADPNSPEYKMGLKMAESLAAHFERKEAQKKLKEIKTLAKIENDTKTLEIIKKYKKAGAIVTVQKIEEMKANNEL